MKARICHQKYRSQKKPATDPKTTKEIITEIKNPGIANNKEYKYLFFHSYLELRDKFKLMVCEIAPQIDLRYVTPLCPRIEYEAANRSR